MPAVHQSRMNRLEQTGIARLAKVPPFLVPVVNEDTIHGFSAQKDTKTAFNRAADTIKYHAQLVLKECNHHYAVQNVPGFILSFLQPPSSSQDELSAITDSVLGKSPSVG